MPDWLKRLRNFIRWRWRFLRMTNPLPGVFHIYFAGKRREITVSCFEGQWKAVFAGSLCLPQLENISYGYTIEGSYALAEGDSPRNAIRLLISKIEEALRTSETQYPCGQSCWVQVYKKYDELYLLRVARGQGY